LKYWNIGRLVFYPVFPSFYHSILPENIILIQIALHPMSGIYIHIPFCKHKCHYCNFFSSVSIKKKDELLEALLFEIELQKDYLHGETIKTIYIGGGTPSLLKKEDILNIYNEISRNFNIDDQLEFTLEANPDDLNREKLTEMRDTPLNRLSIGVQSFFDEDLQYLNRMHNAKQSKEVIIDALNVGYENLSVDLIYGIPGQSRLRWKNNVEILTEMKIPHISAYSLTVEPGTIFENRISKKKITPPDENLSLSHFRDLMKIMNENEYIHYEISNFSKEGFFSKHNSNYWFNKKYLGLGPSAHSYNGNERQWNVSNISSYIEKIKNKIIPCEKETLSAKEKFNEYLMVSLRTIQGCDLNYIDKNFGTDMYLHCVKHIKPYCEAGQIKMENKRLYLTEKGKLFADKIAAEIFIVG